MKQTVRIKSNISTLLKPVRINSFSCVNIIWIILIELSNNKSKRRPVRRIKSRLPSTNSDRSLSTTSENVNNDCHLCCENIAIYEYAPCRHCPMCGECSVKLTSDQHEQCIICRKQAKISEIHFRGLLDHFWK